MIPSNIFLITILCIWNYVRFNILIHICCNINIIIKDIVICFNIKIYDILIPTNFQHTNIKISLIWAKCKIFSLKFHEQCFCHIIFHQDNDIWHCIFTHAYCTYCFCRWTMIHYFYLPIVISVLKKNHIFLASYQAR